MTTDTSIQFEKRYHAARLAHASALTEARRQTSLEIERRKTAEKRLAQGARHYHQLLAQSRLMQRQSRRLAHQVLLAQEEERKEISRELHDEVAQILTGINVHLAALQEAASTSNRSLRQRITKTQRLVGQSVQIVHRYACELRPATLDDLGLVPALRSYIKDMPGRKRLRISLAASPGVEALNNARSTVLYRVAQEALTNVARHARAQLVTVRVLKTDAAVRLEIHDDGKAFQVDRFLAAKPNKHLGLLGMKERVEMVGGKFSIESAPGKGTTVRAEIPFRGRHKEPAP
ncbi:MAG: sensor histidine kinase [Opitutaceae bacterium]|jgi:signal transduction histidine kinase|nr:sensor histidine kinase [Opitutaceae bacterium]